MDENNIAKHGGNRIGAGRKKLDIKRQNRTLRAYDDEWELIKQFSKQLKHGNKDLCQKLLDKIKEKTL